MIRQLAVSALAVAAISAVPAPATAADHEDFGRWTDATAIQVYTPTSLVGKGWGLKKAIKAWNATGDVNLTQTSTPCTSDTCIVVEERDYYPVEGVSYWLGLTYFKFDDLHDGSIVGADIHLNADHRGDKRVLAHEIGHALGLGHNDYRRSIMSESAVDSYSVPQTRDYTLLSAKYGR